MSGAGGKGAGGKGLFLSGGRSYDAMMHEAAGRTKTLSCRMDPARASALCAALGLPFRVGDGDALPPFFHQIYFWNPQPPSALGRDGHTRIGDFVPDLGLPRRMWAGGRLAFHMPLRAGIAAEKRSVIEEVARKTGRTGVLALASIRHEIRQNGQLCLTEHQDLVYRADHDPAAPQPAPPAARRDEESCDMAAFGTTLLFHYSALTLNGHRIHYDEDYSCNTEGYGGLVVHGPLLAQLLILKAERELGPLAGFSFRATAPLMYREEAALCRSGNDLWVRAPDGRQIMRARGAAGDRSVKEPWRTAGRPGYAADAA